MKKIFTLIICLQLFLCDLPAQVFTLVRKFPGMTDHISIEQTMGSTAFFSAYEAATGNEVWKSNGTPPGTTLLQDINPGAANGFTYVYGSISGGFVFNSRRPGVGIELWKSDGTDPGTILLKDIRPGSPSGEPLEMISVNGTVYFTAHDGVHGFELWKTDGTDAGTVMVKDIYPGISSSWAKHFFNLNGTIFFFTGTEPSGFQLWKSDGTEAGTVMLKIITGPSPDNNNPGFFTNVNGILFFAAFTEEEGVELWKTDGTPEGTMMVKDIWTGDDGSFPRSLVSFNGALYFCASSGLAEGFELWKSDGTAAGTVLVKDIDPIDGSAPGSLVTLNGSLYFHASDGVNGRELWKSDGTAAGTVMLKDINLGAGNGFDAEAVIKVVNNRLWFPANDGINGEEIWRSNGQLSGTVMAQDIAPGSGSSFPRNIVAANNMIYLSASPDALGTELYAAQLLESPLALTWIGFTGKKQNNDALLSWKTTNEINTKEFVIQRSTNGSDYANIGTTPAANTSGTHSYSFTDPGIISLGARVIYYRLQQKDEDGKFSYSRIIAIPIDNKRIFLLYPNPVNNEVNLVVSTGKAEQVQCRITDNSGRVVKQEQWKLNEGSTSLSIDVSRIAKGIYYLELKGDTIDETKQFIKQ